MGAPYYESAGGLRFACTRCGNCCTRPGPVLFPKTDLERAARHLGLTPAGFRRRYGLFRGEGGIPTLDPDDGRPCTFYDDEEGCTIYEARPTQCRTWPFWAEVVRRRRSWKAAAAECPGMDRGPRHAPAVVRDAVDACVEVGLPEGDPW